MQTLKNKLLKRYFSDYRQKRALLGLFIILSIVTAQLTWASVPNPTVIGPISSVQPGDPSHNYPFGATNINLAKAKYVEEEYFLSGTANQYNLNLGTILNSGPYQTRMLVRMPTKASAFNGTVIVEPLTAAFGFDMDVAWARSHDFLINNGYAWVGVTVNTGPVSQLMAWGAPSGRYNSLNLTSNDYLYDIISQTAQAIRHPNGINPMPGLSVKRVILTGFSYLANNVTSYHNSIQQNANVVDGFLITNGGYTSRTDLPNPVPVMILLAETEVTFSFLADTTQPDSSYFRLWQVAGTNHYDNQTNDYLVAIFTRDGVTGPNLSVCNDPNVFSLIPFYKVQNAAIDGLNRWIKDGIALASAPRIERDTFGSIVRDSDGNALGGIQLSEQKVATATNFQNGGPGLCFLAGAHTPFTQERLDELYPNHGDYLSSVVQVGQFNTKAGYLLKYDMVESIKQSSMSSIGK